MSGGLTRSFAHAMSPPLSHLTFQTGPSPLLSTFSVCFPCCPPPTKPPNPPRCQPFSMRERAPDSPPQTKDFEEDLAKLGCRARERMGREKSWM